MAVPPRRSRSLLSPAPFSRAGCHDRRLDYDRTISVTRRSWGAGAVGKRDGQRLPVLVVQDLFQQRARDSLQRRSRQLPRRARGSRRDDVCADDVPDRRDASRVDVHRDKGDRTLRRSTTGWLFVASRWSHQRRRGRSTSCLRVNPSLTTSSATGRRSAAAATSSASQAGSDGVARHDRASACVRAEARGHVVVS